LEATNSAEQKQKRFILTGDIKHPGRIAVNASTLEEALRKAEDGEFSVYDESHKILAFEWNGDQNSVEELKTGDE